MKRIMFTLLLLATLLIPSAGSLADEMLIYPFQYADLDAYAAATGNTIDMSGGGSADAGGPGRRRGIAAA